MSICKCFKKVFNNFINRCIQLVDSFEKPSYKLYYKVKMRFLKCQFGHMKQFKSLYRCVETLGNLDDREHSLWTLSKWNVIPIHQRMPVCSLMDLYYKNVYSVAIFLISSIKYLWKFVLSHYTNTYMMFLILPLRPQSLKYLL